MVRIGSGRIISYFLVDDSVLVADLEELLGEIMWVMVMWGKVKC